MSEGHDPYKKAKDVGSESPASEEAKQQGISADRGHQASGTGGGGHQPPDANSRRGARHQEPPEQRKSFEAGHAPSEQGEKDHPSPHVIAQHQQGAEPRSGSHMQGDRSEEVAQRGGPDGEHTRHGRQSTGGDRPGNRTE